MRRKFLLLLIPLGFFLIADQAVQWTVLDDGYLRGRRIAPFDPPLFNAAQEAAVERLRGLDPNEPLTGNVVFDKDLGWCVPKNSGSGDYRYDGFGSRIGDVPLAKAKPEGVRRLCVIGGSFTHCDEVSGPDAWPAMIDRMRDDWEVANLGVGGYGIDQAWMRYERDGRAIDADEVWLCVMPTALPRILSVYRPALRHREVSIAFKPRYRLHMYQGVPFAEEVPCPVASIADIVGLVDDSEAFLAAVGESDFYVARWRSAYAPEGSAWWHRSATARLIATKLEDSDREPAAALLDEDSVLSQLAGAIVDREFFLGGGDLRIVLLPDGKALRYLAETGTGYWSDWLEKRALWAGRPIDLSAGLVRAGIKPTGDKFWRPNGHYSAVTNQMVADLLVGELASDE